MTTRKDSYEQILKEWTKNGHKDELCINTKEVEVYLMYHDYNFTIYKLENKTSVTNLEKAVLLFMLHYSISINKIQDLHNRKVFILGDVDGTTSMPTLSKNHLNLFPTKMNSLQGEDLEVLLGKLEDYGPLLMKPQNGGKKKTVSKKKTVRKNKGIYQRGPKAGKLKPGYKYSGKKT